MKTTVNSQSTQNTIVAKANRYRNTPLAPIDLSKRARTLYDNETPFNVISLAGEITIYQIWTKKGAMGFQCCTLIHLQGEGFVFEDITGGYGYCKESEGLNSAFREIGLLPRGQYKHGTISYNYHIGGNYYRINKKDILKYK